MNFQELDTVVLRRDLPKYKLRRGDLGAVVMSHGGAFDVEFVRASGRTQAVVRLSRGTMRAVRDDDILSVRSAART